MTNQEACCVCGHDEHDGSWGECYTSGCKCRTFQPATDQEARDELARVIYPLAFDSPIDDRATRILRGDAYRIADTALKWMAERGYRKQANNPVPISADLASKIYEALRYLDGSDRSAVRLLTGLTDEAIDELGGLTDD